VLLRTRGIIGRNFRSTTLEPLEGHPRPIDDPTRDERVDYGLMIETERAHCGASREDDDDQNDPGGHPHSLRRRCGRQRLIRVKTGNAVIAQNISPLPPKPDICKRSPVSGAGRMFPTCAN
jgi:hypothetical protein